MKYRICEKCGAHLDFGEHCDCEDLVKNLKNKKGEEIWNR